MVKHKDMEFLLTKMVIDTKDNLRMVSNMEKVSNALLMVIFIKGSFKMISQTVMGNIIGKIRVISKDIFQTD